MADDVVIGSASVQITGDYSDLARSFSDAQNLAQKAGQQIGDSLATGAAGADKLTASAELTDEGIQALFADGMKAAEAWTKFSVTADQAAAGLGALGAESTKAASGVKEVGSAAAQATLPLNDAASASNDLLESFAGLAAGLITARAIQQVGEESLMAFGHVQQLTTSLDLMGAGAEGAARKVEELKTLSVQLAVPFDEIASQARKLSAVFGTGMNMNAVLKAAADDAAATGRSFDTVANALERIEAVGSLSGRQLVTLGISWEQMAHSMGVSVEEAQNKMKQGAQSASQDVADVIAAIESKFGDASERQAANVLGIWTNVKNQAEFIFQTIGEQLAGIGPIFAEGLKIAASGVIVFIGGIQQVTVAVMGMVREGIEGIKGLGAVAAAAMKGDFVGATVAAADAYSKIKTASEYTNQSLEDHARKTAESLIKIWADSSSKISATFKPTGDGGVKAGLSNEQYRAMALEIDAETAHQKALLQIKRLGFQEDERLHKVSAEQNLSRLQALNDQELAITEAGIQKKLALQKQKGEGSKDAGLLGAQQKAEDAAAIESIKLQQHVTDVKERLFDEEVKYHVKQLNDELKFDRDVAAHVNKLNTEMSNDRLKALAEETVGEEKHQVAILEMARTRAAYEQNIGLITASQRIARDVEIDSKEDELQRKAIQREIELLEKKSGVDVTYASKKQALENQLQALNDKRAANEQKNIQKTTLGYQEENDQLKKQIEQYQKVGDGIGAVYEREIQRHNLQIQMNTLEGKSSNAEIVHLTNVQLRQQALITTTQGLGQAYKQLMGDVDQAFNQIGASIAQVIMQGDNFWDVWHKTLNSIEQQLLTTVIQAILKMAEAWIINLILGVAAQKTAGSSEIATSAAIGGAAAAASTAAIPIIGPALAIEAGLGMYASILGTFIPLAIAGFSEGGMVPEDMFAMVHKGEYVLPAEKAAQAMLGGGDKSSGGETHLHFDFSGAHFTNGISDNQVASIFNRGFRMSKLAGALPPGRFPQ